MLHRIAKTVKVFISSNPLAPR